MAGNGIRLNHEQVLAAAGQFQKASNNITELRATAHSQVNSMRATWEGQAAHSFDGAWQELVHALDNAGLAVAELSKGLDQTAAAYLAEDQSRSR